METDPLLVGIDVGTTNIKALVFTPAGETVAGASVPTPTHHPRPGWAHYEPEELWQHTVEILRRAIQEVPNPGRIAGIAAASVGESGVPLDAAGNPTYPAIAWFDTRSQDQAAHLERTFGSDRLFTLTGLSPQPIYSLCKILWLKAHEPDAFARTVTWLHIADYIAYRLCGAPATDYSLASRTLAFDLRRRTWSEDLLRELNVSPSIFAPPQPAGTPLGPVSPEAARITGLPRTAVVATGGHDHICGALALKIIDPGAVLNSLGTAEVIFTPLSHPLTDAALGGQGYAVGAHVAPNRYYVIGGLFSSGASVEWLRDLLGHIDYAPLIAEAETIPAGSFGACYLPHLRLGGAPEEDPLTRGAFIGLTPDVTRGALFRAVLEGLALGARRTLDGLTEHSAIPPPTAICATGGNTRNRLLMRIKAAAFNQRVTVAGTEEATSLGAAILGGLGAGVYPDLSTALSGLRSHTQNIEPDPELAAFYDTWYRRIYRRLYPSLRPLHHTIARIQTSA